MEQDREDVIHILQTTRKVPSAVCMHDFILDHIAVYQGDGGSLDSFLDHMTSLAKQGGGVIPHNYQYIKCGGNAFNTAISLATLGVETSIICRTNPLGLNLMEFFSRELPLDLSHVKTDGELAITTAFQLKYRDTMVGPMLNYTGSVGDFTFEDLDEGDLDLIAHCDYFLVSDWHLNMRGTDLAREVFRHARKGHCSKVFDPGEPMLRKGEIAALRDEVLLDGNIDVLTLNDSESIWFATAFSPEYEKRMQRENNEILALECARMLAGKLSCRVDLHTGGFSASIFSQETVIPTFDVPVLRVTGAGDAWNAGNAYGELIGMNESQRILLANAVAAFYVSSDDGSSPGKGDLVEFLKTSKLKLS